MKDPTFGAAALERWRGALRNSRVVEFPEAGHFVQEEAPGAAVGEIIGFVAAGAQGSVK
jgi:pimeloyl-ACP methyl ester carboxylesterase